MSTLSIIVAIIIVAWTAESLALWLSAKLVVVEPVSFGRAVLATELSVILNLALFGAEQTLDLPEAPVPVAVGSLAINFLAQLIMLARLFRTSLLRALGCVLASLLASGMMLAAVFLIVRPFVLELFMIPTHSMAPTLLGPHKCGTCPLCGGRATFSYSQDPFGIHIAEVGICDACQQEVPKDDSIQPQVQASDRIVADKLLSPRRWDLVVYRYQNDPSIIFVKRLVGLPGELVTIKNGAIWINGEQQTLPAEIAKLKYRAHPASGPFPEMDELDGEYSQQLGSGEYLVLGDFSSQSADSRTSGPVPEKNLVGVATLCYRPMTRWRMFR